MQLSTNIFAPLSMYILFVVIPFIFICSFFYTIIFVFFFSFFARSTLSNLFVDRLCVGWLEEYSYFSWQIMTSEKKNNNRAAKTEEKYKKDERAQQARVQQKEITVILLHLMKNSLFPFRSNLLGEDWFSFRIFDFCFDARETTGWWPSTVATTMHKWKNKMHCFKQMHIIREATC